MHDISKHKCRKFFCKQCLAHFQTERVLVNHKAVCQGPNYCRQILTLPPPGTTSQFINIRRMQKFPFVIYADFECLTTTIDEQHGKTKQYQKHTPSSVGLIVVKSVDIEEVVCKYQTYNGEDCVEWFLRTLLEYQEKILAYLVDNERLVMSAADDENFRKAY